MITWIFIIFLLTILHLAIDGMIYFPSLRYKHQTVKKKKYFKKIPKLNNLLFLQTDKYLIQINITEAIIHIMVAFIHITEAIFHITEAIIHIIVAIIHIAEAIIHITKAIINIIEISILIIEAIFHIIETTIHIY